MNQGHAYIHVVVALHLAFGAVFFFLNRERPTRFAWLFAWCWTIESVRAAIMLPALHTLGGRIEEWFAFADVLCVVANTCLFVGFAHLFEVRLPRRLVPAYVIGGIALVLVGRFGWPEIASSQFEFPTERARFYGIFFNLLVMFIPVAIARTIISAWLFHDWRQTRVPGALIAAIFSVPYALFALLAPFQFLYEYYPQWIAFLWVVRVLGFSIGLVMLMLSRQQAAVARSEAALAAAQALARLGSWEVDLLKNVATWSAEMFHLCGRSAARGPMPVDEFEAVIHPDDRAAFRRAQQDVLAQRRAGELQFRFLGPGGVERWIQWRITPVISGTREVVRLSGTAQDVTDRVVAENRIRHLNRVYVVLTELNQAIIRIPDPQRIFSEACRIAVERGEFQMAWIGRHDPQTHKVAVIAHAGAPPEAQQVLRELVTCEPYGGVCLHTGRVLRTGVHAVCNDIEHDPDAATWRDAALHFGYRAMASFPLTAKGATIGTFNLYASEAGFFDVDELRQLDALAGDISFAIEVAEREADRKRAEVALQASEARFRQLAESIDEVFWMIDPRSRELLYVSPAFETIWGRSCASLYAAPDSWKNEVHPEDRSRVEAVFSRVAEGELELEYRIVRADHSVHWILDRAFPVRDSTGVVYRVVGIAQDITAHRRLEEQLRQSQKLEAIGQLSAGVAHDFNNILTILQLQATLGLQDPQTGGPARDAFEEINRAVSRASKLTRQLLAFSRRQNLQPRDLDLNEVVTELMRMLRRIVGEDIRIELHYARRPAVVHADPGMLEQVLMNLVLNARDAMPRGGRLSIETALADLTAKDVAHNPQAREGAFACVSVSDTGCGIQPDVLPRIFEPFFTTKDVGRGTGLGLSTVYGIVQQHDGWITVESEVGVGTTFRVYLPRLARDEETASKPSGSQRVAERPRIDGETVLLVEDETPLRLLVSKVLQQLGYQVLEAATGPAALEVWRQHKEKIRLVISDLVMPDGMSGLELGEHLMRERPGLRVIYTSGYSADIAGANHALQEGVNFIAKPFDVDRMIDTVRHALRQGHHHQPG